MADSTPRRVGLLGAGTMGGVHAQGLFASDRAVLAAVAPPEVSGEVARLASAAGAATVSVDELLASDRLDAVVVATPTDTHAELACRAMEAGMDVFCEKPVSRTLAEAARMVETSERTGAKVAVGHVVRYFPAYQEARELIRAGTLGTVSTARLRRLNANPARVRAWYGEPRRSGGPVLDMAIHDIDWCLWALGPVERVFARGVDGPTGDVATVLLRHRGGALSTVETSWRDRTFTTSLEVCGTAGLYRAPEPGAVELVVELDEQAPAPARAEAAAASDDEDGASYLPGQEAEPAPEDPYRVELEAALAWFAGGPPPLATLGDGVAALQTAEAALLSMRQGRPVGLKDLPALEDLRP